MAANKKTEAAVIEAPPESDAAVVERRLKLVKAGSHSFYNGQRFICVRNGEIVDYADELAATGLYEEVK